ncbi:MAG: ECF transporter S component [Firmicutes bacterium]|nr:ECF transporter S component [Bacillota bacterium]
MKITTKKLVLIALFIALGVLLPQVFHLMGAEAGKLFSPIHIPALLAGVLFGPVAGLLTGGFSVLLSALITSMPPFPFAAVMIIEVASYGLFAGIFSRFLSQDIIGTIVSVLLAMVLGRVAFALGNWLIMGAKIESIGAWFNTMFITKLPAIALHIILVPLVAVGLRKALGEKYFN